MLQIGELVNYSVTIVAFLTFWWFHHDPVPARSVPANQILDIRRGAKCDQIWLFWKICSGIFLKCGYQLYMVNWSFSKIFILKLFFLKASFVDTETREHRTSWFTGVRNWSRLTLDEKCKAKDRNMFTLPDWIANSSNAQGFQGFGSWFLDHFSNVWPLPVK